MDDPVHGWGRPTHAARFLEDWLAVPAESEVVEAACYDRFGRYVGSGERVLAWSASQNWWEDWGESSYALSVEDSTGGRWSMLWVWVNWAGGRWSFSGATDPEGVDEDLPLGEVRFRLFGVV